MANFYSPHYSPQASATSVQVGFGIGPSGHLDGTRDCHYARYRAVTGSFVVPIGFASGDTMRFFTLHSSDRIVTLAYTSEGAIAPATNSTIGLFEAGINHDGPVVDPNIFDAGFNFAATVSNANKFDAGDLDTYDRGKPMWELAALGGQSYTSDPHENWDLAVIGAGTTITASGICFFKANYMSGD